MVHYQNKMIMCHEDAEHLLTKIIFYRHFLVPLAIAQRPRWRRKGTKLHIYNDHTFVAKHLSGFVYSYSTHTYISRMHK